MGDDRNFGINAYQLGEKLGKIDSIHESVERIEALVTKQNGRIRRLEAWRSYITGAIAVLIFAVGLIIKFAF